jgi:hypothetical protein
MTYAQNIEQYSVPDCIGVRDISNCISTNFGQVSKNCARAKDSG